MNRSGHVHTTPSGEDGDGVRVLRQSHALISAATLMKLLAVAAVVAGVTTLLLSPRTVYNAAERHGSVRAAPASAPDIQASLAEPLQSKPPAALPAQRSAAVPIAAIASARNPDDLPSGDPNDIASYLSPTDPVPTMTELIQAMHDMGDHTGIGAFNPPGTSPPLRGLAVPEDFDLPPGYVRHHQVTDEGEPLEPILMFSPDGTYVDTAGREIAIPEDRVVPPELAPPGLPVREIAVPGDAKRQP